MAFLRGFTALSGILCVSALTTFVGYTICYQSKQMKEIQGRVIHTHEVREHIEKFQEAANAVSLSEKGYLLTGNKNYLQAYNEVALDADGDSDDSSIIHEEQILQKLTSDNPYQQQNMIRLEKAAQDLLTYTDKSMKAYDKEGLKAMTGSLDQVHGKRIMDAIHRITEDMLTEEDRLLQIRTELDTQINHNNIYFSIGSIAAFYVGIIYLLQQLYRNMARLRHKSDALVDIVAIQRDVAYMHHDLEAAMKLIAERMQSITKSEGSVIEVLDGDELVYRAASGKATPFVGFRIAAAGSLSGQCIRENAPLKCDDAETDIRVDKEACRKIGVASMIVVPLIREQQTAGVLKVFSSKPYAFTDEHITFLNLMAGVLSAALSDAQVNDRLRQSEEVFRAAMQNASIGMSLISPDGKFQKVNKVLCNLLGYSETEMLQTDFQTLTHPDDLPANLEYVRQMLTGEISQYSMEKRYIHKDGHIIWAQLNVALIKNADGTPKYFIAQTQDISAEKQLVAKLNQSNTQLSRFAYIASHDMQEPLRMMANFAAMIDSEYSSKLDEEGQEYIKFITDSATRMQNMVAGLLEYARVGKDAFNPEEINVMEDIKHILGSLAQAIKDTHASVTYDNLPTIKGNPVQFTSLLQNLISNGLKYQHPNATPHVHVSVEDGIDFWQFSVKDNGIGMEEEHTTKIFEPFVRLHSWKEYKGTGIGLSVCKEIVENHGGKIWVISEPGKGSTFYFTIPK